MARYDLSSSSKTDSLHVLEKPPSFWSRPGGIVVKFENFASVAQGSQVQIPGMDLAPLIKPCCDGIPHKIEEDWRRCQLSDNLSQAKRGRLATDVSSGPIFLTGKKSP